MQESFNVQKIIRKDWLVRREVTVNGMCGCLCAESLKVGKLFMVVY